MSNPDDTRATLDVRDIPVPRSSWLQFMERWVVRLLLAGLTLVLLAGFGLYGVLLPRVSAWKPEIQAQASKALGVKVELGDIEIRSNSWIPSLALSNVRFIDEHGLTVLQLSRIEATLSPRSLLALQPRFGQLYIESPALDIRRTRDGSLRIAGMALDDEPQADAPDRGLDFTDWLLSQGEVAIRHGQIRWIDDQRAAEPIVLREVDFILRNGLRRHELRIDATPPAQWGERWTLRGRFRHGLFRLTTDWREWNGVLYAELPLADAHLLRPHVELPPELRAGRGAARVWLDIEKGQVRGATADVALRDVRFRWPGVPDEMALSQMAGRVEVRHDRESVSLGLQQVGFTTEQGQVWPASDMKLVLRHRPLPDANRAAQATWDGPIAPAGLAPAADDLPPLIAEFDSRSWTGGEFVASELDLELMASVALRAPLGEAMRRRILELAPQGRIRDMRIAWEGPPDRPDRYQVLGRLENLRLQPEALGPVPEGVVQWGRPGGRGVTVQLEAHEGGGRADIEVQQGEATFPGWFESPRVGLDRLQARLNWQIQQAPHPELTLTLNRLTVRNGDLQGELRATWSGTWEDAAAGRGRLNLAAEIQKANAVSLHRYLPKTISASTRHYLRDAVLGGQLQNVSVRFNGNLQSTVAPGAAGKSPEFLVTGRWLDGQFQYLPTSLALGEWPEATRVETRIRLEGQQVEFQDLKARILGLELNRSRARLAWNTAQVPLRVELQARGPVQDALRLIQTSPINGWTGKALAQAGGSGNTQWTVRLDAALAGAEPTRVQGSGVFTGTELRLMPQVPVLTAARGRVDFTEQSFNLASITGEMLGGELTLDGGMGPAQPLRLQVQGHALVESLKAAPEFRAWAPLTQRLSGRLPYNVQITRQAELLGWTLRSPLTGLGIDLPAPLFKPQEANWTSTPLVVQVSSLAPSATAPQPRESVEVQLGRLVQARLIRNPQTADVVAASIGVGMPRAPALPARGIELQIEADRIDIDEWVNMARGGPAGVGGTAGVAGVVPDLIRVRSADAIFMRRHLEGLSAVIRPLASYRPGQAWGVDIESSQVAGRMEWRAAQVAGATRAGAGVGAGTASAAAPQSSLLKARLSRLSIPVTATDSVEQYLDAEATVWPALDVVVEDFELRGRRLGRLEIAAEVEPSGRDWRLDRLMLANADAALNASGRWAARASSSGRRRTDLNFRLDLLNSGALLNRVGLDDAIRGGRGLMQGKVGWLGTPLAPDIRTLEGQIRLDVQEGQFLKVDPGATRLLGVLSLQSLPRRLTLDFRDLFLEGFPFDTINGDVVVSAGVARTQNLRMRGVQAAVLMEGSADVNAETQDLRVLVVPEINAGTASLAYAAINPALGLGTFLAQVFLRRPLMAVNTREFTIKGTWVEPKVERVQRPATTVADIERTLGNSATPGAASAPAAPASAAASAIPVGTASPSSPAPFVTRSDP